MPCQTKGVLTSLEVRRSFLEAFICAVCVYTFPLLISDPDLCSNSKPQTSLTIPLGCLINISNLTYPKESFDSKPALLPGLPLQKMAHLGLWAGNQECAFISPFLEHLHPNHQQPCSPCCKMHPRSIQ